jgi:hypothetical protein
MSPAATQAATIHTSGPIQQLVIGEDTSCQIDYTGTSYEFYPPDTSPGDCGPLVSIDNQLYGPDFEGHGRSATDGLGGWTFFEPAHQTPVSGDGSASNPFVVETTVNLPGAEAELTSRVSHVAGAASFRVDLTLRDTRSTDGNVKQGRIYWAGDCYASGSDIGYGFTRPEARSVGCSQNPGNVPAARTIQLLPRSANSHYLEARYSEVWETIGTQASLPDTCRCEESIDNGVALSWNLGVLALRAQTRSLEVAFTESAPPPAPVDSDGDALPDAWESGTGAALDDESLAALGADPNRKDVFVHADWMRGCAPPSGWEKSAIADFAAHGVALHIDSGATSNNSDGLWGTRSRAGEVTHQSELANPVWTTIDAIKDEHFVPADRRRAFHYLLFADKYLDDNANSSDGGLSRGIPDSDLLVANCHFELDINGKKTAKRGDAVMVIHELGHNMGLLHGGFEHQNNKLNYPSVMNYGYAFDAIGGDRSIGYSTAARPDFDENNVVERASYATPILWFCPSGEVRSVATDGKRSDLDFNCNGKTREDPYAADLTRDGLPHTPRFAPDIPASVLKSQGDWNDNALRYSGGGVIGGLQLPPRNDAPVVPEFTSPEVSAQATAAAAGRAAVRKQLVIRPRPLSTRRGQRVIRVTVLANGKAVRQARVRVRGGALARGRRFVQTNRKGVAVLRVKVRATRRLVLSAKRGGLRTGEVIIPVRRR